MAGLGDGSGRGGGAQPPAGGGNGSRWPRVVVPVLAGAAVLLIISALGFAGPSRPGPVQPPAEGSCRRLPLPVPVRQESETVVFPEASYLVDDAGGRPRIDLAGSYRGSVAEGMSIAVISQARSGLPDAMAERHLGDGRYYYQQELRLDERTSCWSAASLSPARDAAGGLLWRIFLVMVPADFGVTAVAAGNEVAERTFKELEVLAVLTIPA
ncbi:hypothetical protein Sru01_68450 [Sphaerisporangium rufum]|uniref:Uncharacterized protein n=1 Tax=Sphaerisporangium rufum TaxID=1381558 RepID=A0A919R9V3_9ACTN|nr:hypothetical protein [Sphaerisporangium rufum]GII81863.1 hypothetical protein Sru01_68450 [Sphaerisporangium rufum]